MVLNETGIQQGSMTPVMDISPWPGGHGFAGGRAWWDYVMSKDERRRLDNLMGVALLDENISHRLLKERDDSLFSAFGLSEETRTWLRNVKASTLVDLARAIVASPQELPSVSG